MRELLTIGELASLFNIKTTKIRFYERKGLLEPTEVSTNGYRLYSFEDLEKLEVILLLREMDVSLEKITKLLRGYNAEDYKALLIELKYETTKQIKILKNKLKMLDNRLDHLSSFKDNDFRILEYQDRYYYLFEEEITNNTSVKDVYLIHKKFDLRLSNYEDKYIFVFNDDSTLKKGIISLNSNVDKLPMQKIEKGKYLEIKKVKDDSVTLEDTYKSIHLDAKRAGYEVCGPIYIIEDFRLFLFSSNSVYLTYEVRLK